MPTGTYCDPNLHGGRRVPADWLVYELDKPITDDGGRTRWGIPIVSDVRAFGCCHDHLGVAVIHCLGAGAARPASHVLVRPA